MNNIFEGIVILWPDFDCIDEQKKTDRSEKNTYNRTINRWIEETWNEWRKKMWAEVDFLFVQRSVASVQIFSAAEWVTQ